MTLIEHTPLRLVIQEDGEGCIPKGAHFTYDGVPTLLIVIGIILVVITVTADYREEKALFFSLVYVLIAGICWFIAWRRLTNVVILHNDIFDLETETYISETKYRHTHYKRIHKLKDIRSIELRRATEVGGCYALDLHIDGYGTLRILSSHEDISNDANLITMFLKTPLLDEYPKDSQIGPE